MCGSDTSHTKGSSKNGGVQYYIKLVPIRPVIEVYITSNVSIVIVNCCFVKTDDTSTAQDADRPYLALRNNARCSH